MVNVLHVVLSLKIGGLERFVLELSKNFSNRVTPVIVCLEEAGDLAASAGHTRIISIGSKPGLKFHSVKKLADIIRKCNINIIHTHNEAAHFYGTLAGFFTGVPVLHTRHGRCLHNSYKIKLLNIISSFMAAKCVGVSKDVTDELKRTEILSSEKALTILNGIDVNAYSPRTTHADRKAAQKETNKCVKIGIIARLDRVKDHSNLLNSCVILNNLNDNFKLFIVGDGPMRKPLERQVKELLLEKKVVFTGTRHDIADILNDLDIYVLSSISEGISLTLLEAMACGLPVVATDVGGNPEVVINNKTGFIIPPKDPEKFAEKILILCQDENLRKRMGNAGRDRVLERFNILDTAKTYEQFYLQILGR